MIKLVVTDIDGVLTDGRAFVGQEGIGKSICFKDLDAVTLLRERGIKFGVLTGERNFFTEYVKERTQPDLFADECKNKKSVLEKYAIDNHILMQEICYVGDGRYDIEAIEAVGLGVCPHDAIEEVKRISHLILACNGGNGCLAELNSWLNTCKAQNEELSENNLLEKKIMKSFIQHKELINCLIDDEEINSAIVKAIECITSSLKHGGQLLLCGNGGSAADAQHLATELVSRFYKERKALNAEALTVNTSALTAIANDYDYSRVFARQIEAKGKKGDVLLGITTSGSSENIIEAFRTAKKQKMTTIAFVGNKSEKIKDVADIIISVPSTDTPRIQEIHIMIGHIVCECVEKLMF